MDRPELRDRKMIELFRRARRADEAEAPGFRELRRAPDRRRGGWHLGRVVGGLATATASLVLALALWAVAERGGQPVAPPGPTASPTASLPTKSPSPSPPDVPPQAKPTSSAPASDASTTEVAAKPDRLHGAPVESPPSTSGGIVIRVVDAGGNPIQGAAATVSHETGYTKPHTSISDEIGRVGFPVLRPGPGYQVDVKYPGMGARRTTGIEVVAGKTAELPMALAEETLESVRVVAAADVITLREHQAATKLEDEFVQDAPLAGRAYEDGILSAREVDVDAYVKAARSRDFRVEAAGVSNVDPLTGRPLSAAAAKSLERMEAVNASANVRFAASGGARGFSGLVRGDDEASVGFNTESYDVIEERGFQAVLDHPLSTFSIDVDTASYANVRRFLSHGALPPANAVRIEELINYFTYDYPAPKAGDPFSVTVEIADCPWAPEHRLARIGLKGRTASRGDSRGSNLVFLIDVSGSMRQPAKLPLLKSALRLLVNQLDGRDTVSMVVYAGSSGLVLEPTSGDDTTTILDAIDRLAAGGGTNGGEGIRLAYKVARENFIPGGINRVILATDGDFNLGVTDNGLLLEMLEKDARSGIFLTGLGFGMGNYKDDRLETLADKGNGNYHYIDSEREAQKVLVEGIDANLITIAKDVKIQVEFNPTQVASYRLIGYENRRLAKEDFNDDTKDAGEIGAGHTVTALYEIVPAGVESPTTKVDPLRYQKPLEKSRAADSGELMTVKLRYKEPEEHTSRLLGYPVVDEGFGLAEASDDFRFAATVAAFGMVLRDSEHKGAADLATIADWVRDAIGPDKGGHRVEFQYLIDKAREAEIGKVREASRD